MNFLVFLVIFSFGGFCCLLICAGCLLHSAALREANGEDERERKLEKKLDQLVELRRIAHSEEDEDED